MDKQKTEYAIISNVIDILSVQCSGNRDKIIDLLTGYLWDEEEAGGIKISTGKFEIETPLLDQLESGPWPSLISDIKGEYENAVNIIQEKGFVSISSIQRHLRIGYNHALRVIERMQSDGIVSEPDKNGHRSVL